MQDYMTQRLEKLRELLSTEGLEAVIISGRENTRYLSGFSGSTSLCLITLSDMSLFVDSRYNTQAKAQCSGTVVLEEQGSLSAALCKKIEALQLKDIGIEDEALSLAEYNGLKAALSWQHLHGLSKALAKLRWVKDEVELAAIRKAVQIADEAFALTLPKMKLGMKEQEVAAILEYNMKVLGAAGPSFDTIIASGLRSALPHGIASEKVLEKGDAVVMDFGAVYQGYCSDMTRTVFMGEPQVQMREIYGVVLEAQRVAEELLRSDLLGKEVHQAAAQVIADAGYGAYFGHGLGHSLGLEIHEEPRLNSVSETLMPAGVLMTIEPGIYMPELGGVRIEDTVIIKEEGIEILTQSPKDLLIL